MKTVYKYPFSIRDKRFSLILPVGWKFLSVLFLDELPQLWAEVSDGAAKKEYKFAMYGTGQDIEESATYLTTFSVGPFIFHLYQL